MAQGKGVEVGTAIISLIPSFKGGGKAIQKELDGILPKKGLNLDAEAQGAREGRKFRDSFKRGLGKSPLVPAIGVAAAGTAAAGMVSAIGEVVGAANDQQQALETSKLIFKSYYDYIEDRSAQSAKKLGMSTATYLDNANALGNAFKNSKVFDVADLAKQSDNYLNMAADLAASANTTTEEAAQAIVSAMRGEADPIEKYGISINEASVKREVEALGLKDDESMDDDRKKAIARASIIKKQSQPFTGKAAAEADTFGGATMRLSAQFDDIKARVGKSLTPVVMDFFNVLTEKGIPALEEMTDQFKNGEGPLASLRDMIVDTVKNVSELTTFIIENKDAIITIGSVILGLVTGLVVLQTTLTVVSAAQGLFNAVMNANPIVRVISIIAGLVGIFVTLYNTNEDFRNGVNNLFQNIMDGFGKLRDWFDSTIVPWWGGLVNFFKENNPFAGFKAPDWLGGLFGGVIQAGQGEGEKFLFASGGVLPGYSPGTDNMHFFSPDGTRLSLSGGEAILRPEVTRALGTGLIHSLNGAARAGGVSGVRKSIGFASGGVYGSYPSVNGLTPNTSAGVGASNPVSVNVYVQAAPDAQWVRTQARVEINRSQKHQAVLNTMRRR